MWFNNYISNILFLSCTRCVKNSINNSTINTYNTNHINKEEPEWLIIGNNRVRNPDIMNRNNEYILKSEIENITYVFIHINPNDENRASNLEGIDQLINLEHIVLLYHNWEKMDLMPLNKLNNLHTITFSSGDISKLNIIPDLRDLIIRESINSIIFEDCAIKILDNIRFLPNLRYIKISRNTDTITDISALNQLRKLEKIEIWSNEDSIFNINDISSLENLKLLRLDGKQVDARGIENLLKLEEIYFSESDVLNSQFLSELINLRDLTMTIGSNYTNFDISFLKKMENLEYLRFYAGVPSTLIGLAPNTLIDLSPIAYLTQLKYLELNGFILKNVSVIDNLQYVSEGYFYNSILYDEKEATTKRLILEYDGR